MVPIIIDLGGEILSSTLSDEAIDEFKIQKEYYSKKRAPTDERLEVKVKTRPM